MGADTVAWLSGIMIFIIHHVEPESFGLARVINNLMIFNGHIVPYCSGLTRWHHCNRMIMPVPVH